MEEGPRDFNVLLSKVADGAALSELSTEVQRIVGLIRDEAMARREKVKGGIQLKLIISIDPNGHADVGYDIKVAEPSKKRPETLFFVTKGNNLSDQMTKQPNLPMREVPPPRERMLDDDGKKATKEV